MTCITHFQACDCREHKVAVLMKAASEAATELDWAKNCPALSQETRDDCLSVVTRVHAAIDELAGAA